MTKKIQPKFLPPIAKKAQIWYTTLVNVVFKTGKAARYGEVSELSNGQN